MIVIENLSKSYENIRAIENINLKIEKGEIFGLLGPNGSGKSTLIKCLVGLINYNGRIEIFGKSPEEAKNEIGYVPEELILYESLSIVEYLSFICSIRKVNKKEKIERLLKGFELWDRANDFIGSLSKGNKQKVAIISAIIHEPKLLILDEPLSGLDAVSARIFRDLVFEYSKLGTTIMLSTHTLNLAEILCSKIAIIREGKIIAEGKVEEIKGFASNLEDAFLEKIGAEKEMKEILEELKSA
jgi:ABC-2 type transport system ATP-binding protein